MLSVKMQKQLFLYATFNVGLFIAEQIYNSIRKWMRSPLISAAICQPLHGRCLFEGRFLSNYATLIFRTMSQMEAIFLQFSK